MNRALLRTGGIIAAFIIGYFLPQLQSLAWMIRWVIMLMLFLTFLKIRFHELRIRWRHLVLLLANAGLPMLLWGLFRLAGEPDFAVMAFFIAITPTATAAPVIVGFLKGNVGFMVPAVIVSTVGIGCLLPFLMPVIIGEAAPGLVGRIAGSISVLLLCPFVAAALFRRLCAKADYYAGILGKFQFPLWLVALLLVAGSGSAFIRSHGEITGFVFLQIALLAFGVCMVNFALGYLIGRPSLGRECSQAMGQKNTTLTIYLALTYASPLAALSVTFYVLFHNLWNATQIHLQGRKEHLSKKLEEKEMDVAFTDEN